MINKNLQCILNDLHISQSTMATALDMSRQQLNNILNNRNNLTLEHLLKLHKAYNVNLHYILTGQGEHFITDNTEDTLTLNLKPNQSIKITYKAE